MKIKGHKKINHVNIKQKIADVAILTPDRADFKTKSITKDEAGYFIMTKDQFIKKTKAILNMHMTNNKDTRYMK